MMDGWVIGDVRMAFEGINLYVMVNEEKGNYEMSIILPSWDTADYLLQLGGKLWGAGFDFNDSNNFYYFKDGENNYTIDKYAKCANLTFSREDRKGFLLEDEIEELFGSYRKVKGLIRTNCGDFDGLDNYLLNFGYEDLIKNQTEKLSYQRGYESRFQLNKEYLNNLNNSVMEEVNEILSAPLSKEEVIDFMLDEITELKNCVKKGNGNGIDLTKQRIEHYSKKLDYEPTEMLERIINKKTSK